MSIVFISFFKQFYSYVNIMNKELNAVYVMGRRSSWESIVTGKCNFI